jgi:ACT domain-containing protein
MKGYTVRQDLIQAVKDTLLQSYLLRRESLSVEEIVTKSGVSRSTVDKIIKTGIINIFAEAMPKNVAVLLEKESQGQKVHATRMITVYQITKGALAERILELTR